jgi:hypothetical protein
MFLSNDAVNRVNLHSGVQALAQGAGGVFVLIFLLQAGLSIPQALIAYAGIMVGRFLIRPAVLPVAKRVGIKPMLVGGAILQALPYFLLAEVRGVGWTLAAVIGLFSLAGVVYWNAYNAYFSVIGDAEHRGHQLGVREALVAAAGVLGPILGAWALLTAGPRWTFVLVGLVELAAVLPLLRLPNIPVPPRAPGVLKAARPAAIYSALDGLMDAFYIYVWQIALFVSLGESLAAYGGAMALAGLVGGGAALLLGRHIDLGFGRRAVVMVFGVGVASVLLRAASLDHVWLAVAASGLSAVFMPLLGPVIGGSIYNMAKASPCTLRYHLATEAGWDVGGVLGCLICASLIAAGAPLSLTILCGLPAVLFCGWWLRRLYPA